MPPKNKRTTSRKRSNNGSLSIDNVSVSNNKLDSGIELRLTDSVAMLINTGNCQDQGERNYQEDSFGYSNIIDSNILSNKGMFAILSDGMGGLSDGKAVADYVVQTSISLFSNINPQMSIKQQLEAIAYRINDQISEQYAENGASTAGATMVLTYIFKDRIYWVAVGDSRLYCFRNGHLFQMNEDHDYKNQLYREYIDGNMDRNAIETDTQKDSLVSFIGKSNMPCIDTSMTGYMIKPNDIFILCSDGVYNGISEDSLKNILVSCNAQSASEKIVQTVKNAHFPGQDNMTVMVIKCSKKF